MTREGVTHLPLPPLHLRRSYVGYGKGGLLTEGIRTRPYSLVLLEGVDRAHPEVLALLAQALEEGSLTDAMGRRADFSNAIVAMTVDEGCAGRAEDSGKDLGARGAGHAASSPRAGLRVTGPRDSVLPQASQVAHAAHAGALSMDGGSVVRPRGHRCCPLTAGAAAVGRPELLFWGGGNGGRSGAVGSEATAGLKLASRAVRGTR